ncbi:MAG: PKD domain-containing protein, partial [Myxococcales bacterium]
NEKAVVQLHGAGIDPDGDAITYAWTQVSPAKPVVALSSATDAAPFFTAPEVDNDTTFVFELAVRDGSATSTSTVSITVQNAKGRGEGSGGCSTGGAGSIAPMLGLLGFLLLRRRRPANG